MSAKSGSFKEAFIDWLLTHSIKIMIVNLLLVLAVGFGASHLYIDTDWKIFFDKDDPNLIAEEHLQSTYGKSDNILFIIAPEDANVFTRETLSAVESLTEQAWQTPHSVRVDSITNYQYPRVEGDDIIVEDLVRNALELTKGQIDRIKDIAVNDIGLVNRLIAMKGDVTAVNVTLNLPESNRVAIKEAVDFSRELRSNIISEHPQLTIHLAGFAVNQQTLDEVIAGDAKTLIPSMFMVVLIILAILLRSLSATLATLFIIALSIIIGMGFAGWVGFAVNNVSVSAPTIIMTLAVADCVHLFTTYLVRIRSGVARHTALKQSLTLNFYPIFLTSVTTAFGFLTLNFSDSPPFRELGTIAAAGVLGSLWMTVFVLPGLIKLLPIKVSAMPGQSSWGITGLAEWVIRHQNPIFYIVLAGAIFCSLNIFKIQLNDNPIGYFSDDIPMRKASIFLEEHLTGTQSVSFSLAAGKSNGISDPQFLYQIDEFVAWLRGLPEVENVESFTDILKRLNQVLHEDKLEQFRLPDNRELAAQLILLYELSLPYGLDLNYQINTDKSAMKLTFTVTNIKSRGLIDIENRAAQWLSENAPSIASRGASQSLMSAHIGQRNIENMIAGSLVAMVLISCSLILAFKSVRYGLLSFVPNMFPALVVFGVWGLLVGEVNMAASVVFSLTLGIIVDDTIHFLDKYIRGRRENGLNPEDAVRYAFSAVGKALVLTSIVLAGGFLILTASDFMVNATAGLLVASTIVIAIVLDLLFLPVVLIKIDSLLEARGVKFQY